MFVVFLHLLGSFVGLKINPYYTLIVGHGDGRPWRLNVFPKCFYISKYFYFDNFLSNEYLFPMGNFIHVKV